MEPVSSVVRRALGRRRSDPTILVEGTVQHGDQRGRELGFPTANLVVSDEVAKDGVWAGFVEIESGDVFPAAISVGRRVTFYGKDGVRLLEAYLLDFGGDLYDQRLRVRLQHHLRPQRRFDGVEALVEQMHRDVEEARAWAAAGAARPVAPRPATDPVPVTW